MESNFFTFRDPSPPTAADGPLAGTSVAIQPNVSVHHWPTDAASRALENYAAIEDATLVVRLRQAGASLSGRTRMSELGFGVNGDSDAAVVTRGLVDLLIATDTTGEARAAAAAAGCFGYKPSYGIVSRYGLIGLVPSMECPAILAASLPAVSAAAGAIAGPDPRDPSMDASGAERAAAGFQKPPAAADHPQTAAVIQECVTALNPTEHKDFEQALSRIRAAGIRIKTIRIKDFPLAPKVHNVIGSVEASSSAGKFDGVRYGHRTSAAVKNWNDMYIKSRGEAFGPLVKAYLFQGGYFQYRNYAAFVDACRIRARLAAAVEKAVAAHDLLLLPVCNGTPPTVGERKTVADLYDGFAFTLLANLTGHPALTIPAGSRTDRGPFALQLIGLRCGDAPLLSFAARLSDIFTGDLQP